MPCSIKPLIGGFDVILWPWTSLPGLQLIFLVCVSVDNITICSFSFLRAWKGKKFTSFVTFRFRFQSFPFSSLDFHTLVIVVPAKWRENWILITRIETMKLWFGEIGTILFPESQRSWEPGWDRDTLETRENVPFQWYKISHSVKSYLFPALFRNLPASLMFLNFVFAFPNILV